ncbi:MAG: RIP metalloprotease RseP, partial [Spirochaetales bacterium]|nr:RIP metalloprotease RseP [Spirochaetales bacterium]
MMATLLSFVIGLIALAFMITVHEAGHFFMARLLKIEVEVFAIGFGKAIKRWQGGKTEIRLNIFPLGGYCRLKGSEDLKEALDRGDSYLKDPEEGSLFKAHPLKRIAIYLGGPLFNIILALLLFILFFTLPSLGYDDSNQIVITSDYPTLFALSGDERVASKEAGMASGDRIIKIDGVETPTFYAIQNELNRKKEGSVVEFTLERNRQEFTLATRGEWEPSVGKVLFGISVYLSNVVSEVDPLSPEALASLEVGDKIVEAGGVAVNNALDFLEYLAQQASPVVLKVVAPDGEERLVTYQPLVDETGSVQVGFTFRRDTVRYPGRPLFESIKMGAIEGAYT